MAYWVAERAAARWIIALLAILVIVPPLAWLRKSLTGPPDWASATRASRPIGRVILITVDTLRADVLSSYNDNAPRTPNLDQLASDGLKFRHAVSPGSWTVPAMASILTGVYPTTHHLNSFGARLPGRFHTLAEYMREAGYVTGAVGYNGNLGPQLNFDQGFLDYNWFPRFERRVTSLGAAILAKVLPAAYRERASTSELIDLALTWIQGQRSQDFFFWLHLYDPHQPYEPPSEFLPPGKPPRGLAYRFSTREVGAAMAGKVGRTPEERTWIKGLYNGEVQLVDEQLGRLFRELRRQKLYEDTLIVLTSDHGEEFWEHGGYEHGQSLYGEMIDVPLIVKLPRSTRRGTVDATVSTASILPTILDLCGIEFARGRMEGRPLAPLWAEGEQESLGGAVLSAGLMRGDPREAVTGQSYRYIESLNGGGGEMFDLREDPQQQADLAGMAPGEVQRMREILELFRSRSRVLRIQLGLSEEPSFELDEGTKELLRSMGYL